MRGHREKDIEKELNLVRKAIPDPEDKNSKHTSEPVSEFEDDIQYVNTLPASQETKQKYQSNLIKIKQEKGDEMDQGVKSEEIPKKHHTSSHDDRSGKRRSRSRSRGRRSRSRSRGRRSRSRSRGRRSRSRSGRRHSRSRSKDRRSKSRSKERLRNSRSMDRRMPSGSSSQHRRDRARSRSYDSRDRSYERREKKSSFYHRNRDDSYERHRSADLAKSSYHSQQKQVSDASGLAELTRNLEKSNSQRKDQIREETKKTFSPYATSSTSNQVKGSMIKRTFFLCKSMAQVKAPPLSEWPILEAQQAGQKDISISANANAAEVVRILEREYPPLRDHKGGFYYTSEKKYTGEDREFSGNHVGVGANMKTLHTGFKQSPTSTKMIYIIPLGTDLHLEEPVGLQMGECEICGMKIALDLKKSHMDEHSEEEREDRMTIGRPAEDDAPLLRPLRQYKNRRVHPPVDGNNVQQDDPLFD